MKETTFSAVSSVEPSHDETGRGILHNLGNMNQQNLTIGGNFEKAIRERHSKQNIYQAAKPVEKRYDPVEGRETTKSHSRPAFPRNASLKDAPAGDFRFFQELTAPAGSRRQGPSPRSGSSPSFGYAATLADCPNSSKEGLLQVISAFSCALRGPLNSMAFLPTIEINQ
jgi:hypothetical protein